MQKQLEKEAQEEEVRTNVEAEEAEACKKAKAEAATNREREQAHNREQQEIAEEKQAVINACGELDTEFGGGSTMPIFDTLMVPHMQTTLLGSSDEEEKKDMDNKSIDSQTEETPLAKQDGEDERPPDQDEDGEIVD